MNRGKNWGLSPFFPDDGFTIVEMLLALILICLVLIFIIPGCSRKRDIALKEQTIENLKVIQAALERYASDHNGEYPQFLIGGDKAGWDPVSGCDAMSKRPAFAENIRQTNFTGGGAQPPLDPLIAGGYLESYPENPFITIFKEYAFNFTGGDISKPGSCDIRFGFNGTAMGNVIDDPRFLWDVYTVFDQPDKTRLQPTRLVNTFSPDAYEKNVGSIHPRQKINPFYSTSGLPDNQPSDDHLLHYSTPWWPGQFLYRASGEMILKENTNPEKLKDSGRLSIWDFKVVKYDKYILAGYGAPSNPGLDLIRMSTLDHKPINNHSGIVNETYRRGGEAPYDENIKVFMSPPEIFGGGDLNNNPVFPYCSYVGLELLGEREFIYGAPDGYPDGIIEPVFIDHNSTIEY